MIIFRSIFVYIFDVIHELKIFKLFIDLLNFQIFIVNFILICHLLYSIIYCILLISRKKRGSLPAKHSLQEAGGGRGQVDEREGHRRAPRWRRRRRGSRRKYLGLARPGRPLAVAELAPGDQHVV